ncbi:flagellar hook protein FlgE [Buchnera aphidicola]|uniref:flagellar hook protein FlgE n=1 Tax=Buchnera aphidicola TaxID=9 RepID=UPI003463D91F
MGLLQAISGLYTANTVMNVISDNISNASTIGFKSKSVVLTNLENNKNIINKTTGMGVNILKKKYNINSGEIFYTNRNLDLSITKNGFFRLSTDNGEIYYTRNGHFYIDKNYHIINKLGMYLTGYPIDHSSTKLENNYSKLIPINLSHFTKTMIQPTTILKFFVTLNNNHDIKINKPFDIKTATTYNHKLKTKIIDHLGKERFIYFYFIKATSKIWYVYPCEKYRQKKIIPFKIEFDKNGHVISKKTILIKIKLNKEKKEEKILLDLTNLSQKKTTNNRNYFSQNGYTEGTIQNYEIDKFGTIYGIYSNQKKIPLSKIILSHFTNSENLTYERNSIWSKNNYSGLETIGLPNSLNFGKIISGSLEKSNVDLNKELINMIIAQRNYQSNAQVIKTEEKMFNTLINL